MPDPIKVGEGGVINWDGIFCRNCPNWEEFQFEQECEGCEKPHSGVAGLCRGNLPKVSVQDGEQGQWPVTNADDWCAPGRRFVLDIQDEALEAEAEEKGHEPNPA